MATYHCFRCHGPNPAATGPCVHCGGEIAAPAGASYDDRLVWTLRHPDPDRAITAARILGERRADSAAPALEEIVHDPPDPYLAAQCLRSLLLILSPADLRPLLEEVAAQRSFLPASVAREALDQLESRDALLAIAAEALELEREAEAVLEEIRSGGRLARIAPDVGAAAGRFTELRQGLPDATEPRLRHIADLLDSILNHHTWLLSSALALVETRDPSEQIERERRELQGFGRTTGWLKTIVDALRRGSLAEIDTLPWPGRIPLSE